MDSPQSVVSPFKISPVAEPEKQKFDLPVRCSALLSRGTEINRNESFISNLEGVIGVLEVYIHQARDIHNICIYHKQDVYAKICLTSDPEITVSTKIINGGGRNPVFNDNLKLDVRNLDSSLKCEIWMLSRVKNYLEDQLLGFALVPMSEVLMKNGMLEKEFSLSSTDLFHSPAGFVQLSLSYKGASPEVMAIPALVSETIRDSEVSESSLPGDLDKIEFPDPKIANEDQIMVSEFLVMSCSSLASQSSESLATSDAENHHPSSEVVESFQVPKLDSPPSSVSTNGVSSISIPASSESSETPHSSKSPSREHISPQKPKSPDAKDGESDSSSVAASDTLTNPLVSVNIEPEPKVVQQDFVDLYMKSMQQFTESLAKMKLPLDIDPAPASSGDSTSEQKTPASKNSGSRVFYGSRAFF